MKLSGSARSPGRLALALGVTLLGPVVATAIGFATGLEGRAGSAALFLVAVLVSTLIGGFAFGVATAVISYVPYLYYFVEPVHSFVPSGSGYAAVVAFAGAVVLIVVLLHREQRARNDAIGAHDSATATAAQMERLQRLAALLAAAVTPAQIARILVSEGTAAVGATAGWVSVLSDETDELEHLSSLGYAESFVEEHRLIPLEGLHVAAQVARTGQPLWLETTSNAERTELRSAHQATGAEALALVPLRTTTDLPLGFMALRFPGPRVFTAADRDLLETFARQASEALQRSRLFESERQARRIATRLQSLTAALSAAAERSDVVRVIVDQTLEAFDATACDLYVSADGELRLAGHAGADPASPADVPADVERAILGESAASHSGDRSSIAVPLALGPRVFGALHIAADEPRSFDGADRTLAEAVASPCAQALERAELYQREFSARRTAQLATERLVRLQAMTAALATAVTVEDVTEVAVTQGAQAFGADAAAVHLVSDDAETLVVSATVGYTDRSSRLERLSMDEPLAAIDAVRRGKILWFASHGALERRFPAEADVQAPWEATGLVPLVGREGPLGLLTLQFGERRPRRREDRALLATIGRQCGQAVERARLYEHERDARELESRLQELTAAVSGISGVDEIGDRVTAQLATLLGASAGVVVLNDPDGTLRPLATHDGAKTGEQTQTFVSSLPVAEAIRAGQVVVRDDGPSPAIGVPLVAGGKTIGAIGIELERSDGLVAAELDLLEALGTARSGGDRIADVYLHTDAVQAAAKMPLQVSELACDLLTISGHKIHRPRHGRALRAQRCDIEPMIYGGRHERSRRAGTENVPGIVGLGRAAALAQAGFKRGQAQRLGKLRNRLEQGILASVEAAHVNGQGAPRVPNITNISFDGIEGESLVIALDLKGLAVSTGAACSSGAIEPSHVLLAMGLRPEQAKASIRFSLGTQNTKEDVDFALSLVPETVARLRQLSPMWGKESVVR